jgi:hypothetical protein
MAPFLHIAFSLEVIWLALSAGQFTSNKKASKENGGRNQNTSKGTVFFQ